MADNNVTTETARILPTLIYIQTHLDEDLSLERLAELAAISPFHFHRLFQKATGETLKRYTQRLRLERAAFELKISAATILEIALAIGFSSHETFSRAFKRHFAMTPIRYRLAAGRLMSAEMNAQARHSLNRHTVGYSLSKMRVHPLAPLPLAFIRQLGSYEEVDPTAFEKLIAWSRRRGLYTGDNLLMGIGHDDPSITPLAKVRYDACIQVSAPFRPDGAIGCQMLPAGTYASVTYVGPFGPVMSEAYGSIYGQALNLTGYRFLGLPAIEIYRTTSINPAFALNETDIFLPVERITTV